MTIEAIQKVHMPKMFDFFSHVNEQILYYSNLYTNIQIIFIYLNNIQIFK